MLRSLLMTLLIVLSFFPVNIASAQQSPPLCPEGSWAQRANGGWKCSKSHTPDDTPASTGTTSGTKSHGHHGSTPQ